MNITTMTNSHFYGFYDFPELCGELAGVKLPIKYESLLGIEPTTLRLEVKAATNELFRNFIDAIE